ncbi:MAG: hypothetical protein HOJ22_01945 [Chloroflexi bacterium]|jgi:hypothetical protein|nr:hypothetical protein [Chloroflexota bacterium]MBT5627026.1 hypothetical protein [Chloroflexota bacterium]
MSTQNTNNSDIAISRLRSAAHTGSLKAVVGELADICKETTVDQCSKLSGLMPRLSVETAMHKVRIFD